MYDNERGTGRTTRKITTALCGMLMGKRVVLVMAYNKHVPQAFYQACKWLHANGWAGQDVAPLVISTNEKRITFGKGSLSIRGAETCLRGMRFDLTVEDHFTIEERERRLLAELRAAEFRADKESILNLMYKHDLHSVVRHVGTMPEFRPNGRG